eukprot:scaffold86915_cov13-Tisochrysis_lutea.AAC.1
MRPTPVGQPVGTGRNRRVKFKKYRKEEGPVYALEFFWLCEYNISALWSLAFIGNGIPWAWPDFRDFLAQFM